MTTASSPTPRLAAQAAKIASVLKAAEAGRPIEAQYTAKIAEARQRGEFSVGIVMDDKIIKIVLPWACIAETAELELRDRILELMRTPVTQ